MFPSASTKPYTIYRIAKPIDAIGGEFVPWFNKPGGGSLVYQVQLDS